MLSAHKGVCPLVDLTRRCRNYAWGALITGHTVSKQNASFSDLIISSIFHYGFFGLGAQEPNYWTLPKRVPSLKENLLTRMRVEQTFSQQQCLLEHSFSPETAYKKPKPKTYTLCVRNGFKIRMNHWIQRHIITIIPVALAEFWIYIWNTSRTQGLVWYLSLGMRHSNLVKIISQQPEDTCYQVIDIGYKVATVN